MKGENAGPKNLAAEIGKRRPFERLEAEAYLNLVRTYEHLEAGFAALFKAHGVTGPQYNVLRILRGHGRRLRTYQIVDDMLTREPDITRLIDRMVQRGLVTRERCPVDRRVVWIELAEAGAKLLKQLDRPVMDLHIRQLGHLGERKLRELSRLLFEARRPA